MDAERGGQLRPRKQPTGTRRIDNNTSLAELDLQQSRNNRLPSLNGSTGVNLQLGRTIDPTTNTFEAQNILSQGYQLQGAVTIYNGGLIKNQVRQAELELEAARTDAQVTGNDVGLQVANSYLTILLTREQLTNARVLSWPSRRSNLPIPMPRSTGG